MLRIALITLGLVLTPFTQVMAAPDQASIEKQVTKLIPGAKVDKISETPVTGLYEVRSGNNIFYTTQNGDYVVYGHMLDLRKNEPVSLTENSLKTIRLKLIDQVDPQTMITYAPKGETKHTITVFSDIDCGYCRKLHQEVPALNKAGIAVRYLSFPRAGLGSASFDKAVNVWCAKDRQAAMTSAKAGQNVPATPGCHADDIIRRHMKLVADLDLRATPVIVLEDGRTLPGYMPADALIAQVNS